jgi:hypothetical protein
MISLVPPSHSTFKNWVARFRIRNLSTEDDERSGRLTQVTVPENMDAIHSMILDDRRISVKKLAETLAISRERVGYIIHEKVLSQMDSKIFQF